MKVTNSSHVTLALSGMAVAAISLGAAQGEVLYNISSFNNNNSTASQYWIPGITDITVDPNLTGTDDAGLLSLQTLQNDPTTTTSGGPRFRNTEPDQNNVRQTLTTDASATQYFQFGIAGGNGQIQLTNLTFDAVRATGGSTVRGFDIDVSVNGGAYIDLGASDVANNRNDGLAPFTLDLSSGDFQLISSIDFRVFSTGGGIEYTNFAINGTLAPPADTDGDGLADLWEDIHFGNADGIATPAELALQSGTDDGYPIPDGDGLDNNGEEDNLTDPNLADTDLDGLNDGPEVNGTNNAGVSHGFGPTIPTNPDSDEDGLGDGISDGDEVSGILNVAYGNASTNPNKRDSDSDGMDDLYEVTNNLLGGLDPNTDDAAGNLDGDPGLAPVNTPLTNLDEYNGTTLGVQTRADKVDTDDDGYGDHVENLIGTWSGATLTGTDPLNSDSDGDGILDGNENPDSGVPEGPTYNSDPNNNNSDFDSLGDGFEILNGLNPGLNEDDQDNDTFSNIVEILNGSNPTNGGSVPTNLEILAGSNFTTLPWLNTGGGVSAIDLDPLLPGASHYGTLNNKNNNTGAMVSIASPGGMVYYSVDLRFTGTLEEEGINILIEKVFRVRTGDTTYGSIRIKPDGSLISHGGPGAPAGTIVAGQTYTCQFTHDITNKTFETRIYDRSDNDRLIYEVPVTDTRNQDEVFEFDPIYFGVGLQTTNTQPYELSLDNLIISTAPIVPEVSASQLKITRIAFENSDLKINFSPISDSVILTTTNDLSGNFTEEANAINNGAGTFTIPAARLNSGPNFYRIEVKP
ncbi:hypothetical protein V2O64_08595 [Verrucomicrobiaceae bacterium 227]